MKRWLALMAILALVMVFSLYKGLETKTYRSVTFDIPIIPNGFIIYQGEIQHKYLIIDEFGNTREVTREEFETLGD